MSAPEHFDAVIVGSGFGGSVMAYRLAEAGRRVCVLERGKAFPPGSYPRSPAGLANNFWDPNDGKYGMFNLWSFRGLEALVASGLGGGSLIYANVLIRKDERWFVNDLQNGGYESWALTRKDLDPYYDRAEAMMGVQKYPFDVEPYASTPKTKAMRDAARRLNLDWMLPPLAVTFGNPGETPTPGVPVKEQIPNLHNKARVTCQLCGECDVGCNYGSKNSLDFTYLTAAHHHGAELRTLCEVETFAPKPGGGFTITYVQHNLDYAGTKLDRSRLPRITVTADRLILAAGTLGTTYLLLKNKDAFPALSKALGTRFCGNGDLLTFAVKCQDTKNGVERPRVLDPNFGPVITSAIRYPDAQDDAGVAGDRGFYIEDAGYPAFLSWLVQMSDSPGMVKRSARFLWSRVKAKLTGDPESDLGAEVSAILGDCGVSSGSLPLLGMGRDIPNGKMMLSDGWLDIDWKIDESYTYFKRVRKEMKRLTKEFGGDFADNIIWYLKRVITVHPLGGCPMGAHPGEGVVGTDGQVFNVPGLYVADGSVMPGPVGPNPSLTIAALAERFADRMV
jgi:cholesterol oxidase